MAGRLTTPLRALYERLFRYAWKFGVIGLIAYVIDVGLFNLLLATSLKPDEVVGGEMWANVVSTVVSTLVAWFGNRYWAFREHRRKNFWLELGEFMLTSIIGLGITSLCLYVSHTLLGYTDAISDNVSKNGVGLVLATVFRFVMYRFLVFSPARKDGMSRLQREADERARSEAALLAAIDPAAADIARDAAGQASAQAPAEG